MDDEDVRLVERVDLSLIQGIYVTEDPMGEHGVRMWCGYCCTPLHFDARHMGSSPFLSLMAKMADAHRETECPKPKGPFASDWSPRHSREWERWADQARRQRLETEKRMAQMEAEVITADWHHLSSTPGHTS